MGLNLNAHHLIKLNKYSNDTMIIYYTIFMT